MNYKKLFFQTIPTVGAIGLSACAPDRDNDRDNNGDGDVTGLVGAWELRSFGYEDGEYYQYPQVYSYDDCTRTQGVFLQVESGLVAEMITSVESDGVGCEYTSYGYRYPGSGQEVAGGLIRLTFDSFVNMDCPAAPGSEMQCSAGYDYDYSYVGRGGYYGSRMFNWSRTTVASIPEVDVVVDAPVPGDEPTDDVVSDD